MVGGGGLVQTDFHVKPTTKLLWVAFGLGCCCLAWLWGYDNRSSPTEFGVSVASKYIFSPFTLPPPFGFSSDDGT